MMLRFDHKPFLKITTARRPSISQRQDVRGGEFSDIKAFYIMLSNTVSEEKIIAAETTRLALPPGSTTL